MSKPKGFTLIELLVVISIIALLMAMLMPSLEKARRQARGVGCQQNLHQWAIAFGTYVQDNNMRFMKGPFEGEDQGQEWNMQMRKQYADERLRCCPMATKPMAPPPGGMEPPGSTFRAWGVLDGSLWREAGDYGSYGINGWAYDTPLEIYGHALTLFWRTPDVRGAGMVPMFLDAQWMSGWPFFSDEPPPFDGGWLHSLASNMGRYCMNRHDGYVNGAFMDYSVRAISLKELWVLHWHRDWNPDNDPLPIWPDWMIGFRDP